MGNYVKKEIHHGVDEVTFKTHLAEFQRFYSNHRNLCDEVAGLKKRSITENNEVKEFFITKENFIFAIRRLVSFVIDNLQFVKRFEERRKMMQDALDLEDSFLNDEEYQTLSSKNRNTKEEIILTRKHIFYINKVYQLGNRLIGLLQNSLMLSTSQISKDVEYHNDSSFFEELGRYRTEISDAIANFRFSDSLIVLKKISGYHYTYRVLLQEEDQVFIEDILNLLSAELLQDENIMLIIKLSENSHLRTDEKERISFLSSATKKTLLKVYYITNKNLSERKILPKILRKIYVDKTLI